jgi:hypothetical protein
MRLCHVPATHPSRIIDCRQEGGNSSAIHPALRIIPSTVVCVAVVRATAVSEVGTG